MPELLETLPESVAAVDLGSNSFHLLVARPDGGEPVVVDRLREMVRLAGGLGKNKRLNRKSQERALQCLRRFGQRLDHMASGTVRAVSSVARSQGWSEDGVTLSSLKRVRDALLKAGSVDRVHLDGLSQDRRPVFPGGVAILLAAFKALRIRSMQAADGALREGLLYDLPGRIREEDVRDRSVIALADRCHVDWQHAGRVECTVLRCLNQVEESWSLSGREERYMLVWAARLHEIGLDVAHSH